MTSIITRACVPALLLVCLLLWLDPVSRTAAMHVALFVVWGLALLQYSRRYGLFAKTIPQVYQAYRRRTVPAVGRDEVILFFAATTEAVWRIMW